MKARDFMTTRVVTLRADTAVHEAIRLMLQHRVSGLPVVDTADRLVGIVTEGDFLRRGETGTERRRPRWLEFLLGPGRLADEYTHAYGRRVEEIMTRDVATVTEDTAIERIADLMERRRVKRLPVLRDGKLVGIVSRANLLHVVGATAAKLPAAAASDTTIRGSILAEIDRQPWGPRASINVVVNDGVVHLHGAILDERERQALIVLAENTPGVREVRDRLLWVEPLSGFVLPPESSGPVPTAAARN